MITKAPLLSGTLLAPPVSISTLHSVLTAGIEWT
jgi:hypothetical protein